MRHIVTGLSGSTHDKTAASWSAQLMNFLDNLTANYVVLGDPAYRGLHPRIITTFTGGNLTHEQQSFNGACTRIRQASPFNILTRCIKIVHTILRQV